MNMKSSGAMVTAVALSAAVAWADDQAPIDLAVGAQKVLTIPSLQRVAVGDPGVCDVRSLGKGQLMVTGKGPGVTTLMLWAGKGQLLKYSCKVRGAPGDAGGPEDEEVELSVGEVKALALSGIARVTVGNPDIADVRVQEKEVLFIGAAPGTTTVLVWTKDGQPHTVLVTVADAAAGEAWALEVGATRELPRPVKVGVSDWDVCHLEDAPNAVVLRGHSAGTAAVTVTGPDGKRVRHAVTVGAAKK